MPCIPAIRIVVYIRIVRWDNTTYPVHLRSPSTEKTAIVSDVRELLTLEHKWRCALIGSPVRHNTYYDVTRSAV